jgi:hypothetical protein
MRLATARAAPPADRFEEAEATFSALVNRLQSEETARMSHSDLETLLERQGRELMRQLLQAHLDSRAQATPTTPVVVGADGVERTHQRSGTRALETLLGTVQVTRDGHGARGHETLFPLDAELNLPAERYSFGIRRRAAEDATKGAFDDVVKILGTHASAAVAKRQVEEVVRRAAQDFDSYYLDRRLAWPTETGPSSKILVLTFDGKGVPMRPADLRPATQAARRQHKLTTRLTKGEKRHVKRIAQVAAVYTIAPFVRTAEDLIRELRPETAPPPRRRPRPEGKRVWASLAKEPEEVIDEAFLDAASRDPKRRKRWVVLLDGHVDQLARVRAAAKRHRVTVTIVLDLIHVLEYLWKAAYVFHAEGSSEAEGWVTERLLWLLCGDAGQVIASIRRTATCRGLTPAARKPADTCADYIEGYKAYVQYDAYLQAGLPIATGVIEGACRYVIRDRMEITGARWSLDGAEAILRLRSLRASGDLDDYWRHHEQRELYRNHAAGYANGKIPSLTRLAPASRRNANGHRLRVVK